MPDRNRVRVESNERIDMPDWVAMQLGAHLAVRYAVRGLVLGADAGIDTLVTSSWTLSTVGTELTLTPGRALAGETMADASIQQGHLVGEDGPASIVLDFNGESAGTYGIYVRPDFSAGVQGSRITWNATGEVEDPVAIDTREVSGWRATFATSSPGDGYVKVGTAVWDGAAFTDTYSSGIHLFEGDLGSTGAETGNQWGGGNDRNADRATYGVQSIFKAFALVRRQLKDIIGAASGGWHSAVPTSLTAAKAHIDTTTDPHGSAPTWTGKPVFNGGIDVNGHGDFRGSGYVEVDAKEDLRFQAETGGYRIPCAGLAAFVDANAATDYSYSNMSDGLISRFNNASSGLMMLYIPVHVPVGATLTGVTAYCYWENQSGAAAEAILEVYVQTNALLTVVSTQLGSDSDDDSTVSGSGAAVAALSVTGLSSVASVLKSYWLKLALNNNGETGKLSVLYIDVRYSFANPVA